MELVWLWFALAVRCGLAYEIEHPGLDGKKCGQTTIEPLLNEHDRIIGGSEAVPGSWPWHIGIFTKEVFSKHICSGALISDRHVVTAAHCLMRKTSKMLLVVLGAHDQSNIEADTRTVEVAEVCFHKSYKAPHENDIAILTLKEKVEFTDSIGQVCLPDSKRQLPENTDMYVTGWGRYKVDSPELSPRLKQLRTRTISHKTCFDDYGTGLPDSVLCTSHDFGSSCKGDSGGPLVWNSGSAWFLEGVVSGGPAKCANPDDPLLFTNVPPKVDTFILPYIEASNDTEKSKICKIV